MKAGKMRILLAVIGLFVSLATVTAAASTAAGGVSNYDLVGTPYYQSVTRLEALGVLPADTPASYPVDNPVPRSYLAGTLIGMLPQTGGMVPAAEGPTQYSDVEAGSRLSGEVNLLDELNIMHGDGGLFRPADAATWSETIRSVMSALYYGEGVNGFSDETVVRTAEQVGLIDQQNFNPDGIITMGQLARLVDKALFQVQLPGSRENLANRNFGVQFGTAWVKESPVTGAPYNNLVFDSQIGAVSVGTPLPLLLAPGLDVDSYLGQKVLVGVKDFGSGGQPGYQVVYLQRLPQN